MKFVTKLIIVFALSFVFSCSHVVMLNSYNDYVSDYQLDSLCKVEKIPYPEYEKWITLQYLDPETNKMINQYTFIKSFRNKNSDEIVYVVTELDSITYKFNKRISKNIKK